MPEQKEEPCDCPACLLASYAEAMDEMDRLAAVKPFDGFAGGKQADKLNRLLEDLRQAGDMARSAAKEERDAGMPDPVGACSGMDADLSEVAEVMEESLAPLFGPGAILTLVARWQEGRVVVLSRDGKALIERIKDAVSMPTFTMPMARGSEKWN